MVLSFLLCFSLAVSSSLLMPFSGASINGGNIVNILRRYHGPGRNFYVRGYPGPRENNDQVSVSKLVMGLSQDSVSTRL